MKEKIKLILFGAGGHALSVIDVIESTNKFKILFCLDNYEGTIGKYKVYKQRKNLSYYKKFTNKVFISIGQIKTAKIRMLLYKRLIKNKFILPNIISPTAYVSKNSEIKNGTIVMHHVLINSLCEIGENCIINSKSLIEHGVKIENNCHIATGGIINGDCYIKKETFIGSNSTIIQGKIVGSNSIIGSGKTLKKNLPSNSTYK